MSTTSTPQDTCSACQRKQAVSTCSGCEKVFCIRDLEKHRDQFRSHIDQMGKQVAALREKVDLKGTQSKLFNQIKEWRDVAIKAIERNAKTAQNDLQQFIQKQDQELDSLITQFSEYGEAIRKMEKISEKEINSMWKQVEKLQKKVDQFSGIELLHDDPASLQLLKIHVSNVNQQSDRPSSARPVDNEQGEAQRHNRTRETQQGPKRNATPESGVPLRRDERILTPPPNYPSMMFGADESIEKDIGKLFQQLISLPAMEKGGPMNGPCDPETTQMERFLHENFGFEKRPGKYIVPGVKSFELTRPLQTLDPQQEIHFPSKSSSAFAMTVSEIRAWQSTYKVYASKSVQGMTKEFLSQALQGKSGDGEEAFRMKFVVRISTCPILMEFDAKVIPRQMHEEWSNNIKLVSVTGIDFAGRKHDVNDITNYIGNWHEVFEVDRQNNIPALMNERDFALRKDWQAGIINENRLFSDLRYMAYLRLYACDREGVQIVVETGIGLGVFAGKHFGVDEKVRSSSAIAMRSVLEEYESQFKNIRAVIFALPVFAKRRPGKEVRDNIHIFSEQFGTPPYKGRIPVLIADQDMHRLTVAIARRGFVVSELNPADSHGVFGEYWQNRGPAVEEKLALTTVGLLVQHHLINPEVLKEQNYHLI